MTMRKALQQHFDTIWDLAAEVFPSIIAIVVAVVAVMFVAHIQPPLN